MRLLIFCCLILLWSGCKQSNPSASNPSASNQKNTDLATQGGAKKLDISTKRSQQETDDRPIDFAFTWRKDTGVDFVHRSGFDDQRAFPAANGSGLGVIDFDLDGWADVYFASGKHFPVEQPAPQYSNRFYRNQGQWKFEDASVETGLDLDAYSTGITVGDFDNDGFQDIYVGCYGPNALFRNLGDGTFEQVQGSEIPHGKPIAQVDLQEPLPDTPGWATSCAFFDYNNDGNLDLYVGNYGIWNLELKNNCGDLENDIKRFCSPTTVRPQSDVLYESNGDGTFTDVSEKAGIYTYKKGKNNSRVRDDYRTQGVIATDFNNDGLIDIYCGNDMDTNLLLINSKELVFQNRTELSSTGYGPSGGSQASMGVAAADGNNDGFMDLFCTNFSEEFNSFYQGLGDLQFAEVSKQNRISTGARPWVGWGTEFVDFDCDGWLDVIVTNGHVDPNIVEFEKGQEHLQPCLIWKNKKGRFRLAKVEGDYFSQKHPGRALALADFDNDGDVDVVVGHQDRLPGFLENKCQTSGRSNLSFRLVGTRSNRDGIGCRLRFPREGRQISRVLIGGGSYLSAHATFLRETRIQGNVELHWPLGSESKLEFPRNKQGHSVIIEEPNMGS